MAFVISVGAGRNQVPFIKRLAKKGYKVIAFDLDKDAPGKEWCYEFAAISTWDHKNAIQWLVDLGYTYEGVGSFSYGKALVTEKKIANYFNLSTGLETASYSIHLDKNEQQRKLYELGLNQYRSYLPHEVESMEEINHFIVKPLVGGSSAGIELIQKKQLVESKMDYTNFVIEPFLEGIELRVSCLIQDGICKATFVMKRENLKGTFCIGRQQPANEYNERVNKLVNKLISVFSIRNSALKLDIIATPSRLDIIEMDFGIAGDHFETHLSWDFFEYKYLDNYIRLITDEHVEQRHESNAINAFSDHLYNLSDDLLSYNEEAVNTYLKKIMKDYKIVRSNHKLPIQLPKSNMDSYLMVIHMTDRISHLELNQTMTHQLTTYN